MFYLFESMINDSGGFLCILFWLLMSDPCSPGVNKLIRRVAKPKSSKALTTCWLRGLIELLPLRYAKMTMALAPDEGIVDCPCRKNSLLEEGSGMFSTKGLTSSWLPLYIRSSIYIIHYYL